MQDRRTNFNKNERIIFTIVALGLLIVIPLAFIYFANRSADPRNPLGLSYNLDQSTNTDLLRNSVLTRTADFTISHPNSWAVTDNYSILQKVVINVSGEGYPQADDAYISTSYYEYYVNEALGLKNHQASGMITYMKDFADKTGGKVISSRQTQVSKQDVAEFIYTNKSGLLSGGPLVYKYELIVMMGQGSVHVMYQANPEDFLAYLEVARAAAHSIIITNEKI